MLTLEEINVLNKKKEIKASIASPMIDLKLALGRLKVSKEMKQKSRAKENELRSGREKVQKALYQSILKVIFETYNITMSNYHGGDVEGLSS